MTVRTDSRVGGDDGACAPGDAPAWVPEFLAMLIVTGSVGEAVAAAGIDFETACALAMREPDFAMYWDKAIALHRSGALAALAADGLAAATIQ